MPGELQVTLKEMAQVALGAPEMGTVNMAVLHSLIDIILRKLDCAEDKVSIGGFESKCIEKILEQAHMSPLPFNDEAMVPISEELQKITTLETNVAALDQKLEEHFEQIRICNHFTSERYQVKFWENYASAGEDLCTVCDEDNRLACSLLQNEDFMKKLMRCMATPIVDRLFEISAKLEAFYQKLKEFLDKTEALFKRLEMVKQCIIEIENLRTQINEYNLTFIGTMEEIQDMLDAKLDKVHMPALKKYIRDRFNDIELRLISIETKATCPRAAGFINTDIKCLSCGNTKVGVDVGPHVMSLLPDAKPHNKIIPSVCDKSAFCGVEEEPTIMVRMKNLDLEVLASRLTRTNEGKVCKLPEANDTIYGVRQSTFSS